MILKEQELLEATLGAIGIFIAGVVDGILRPLRCN